MSIKHNLDDGYYFDDLNPNFTWLDDPDPRVDYTCDQFGERAFDLRNMRTRLDDQGDCILLYFFPKDGTIWLGSRPHVFVRNRHIKEYDLKIDPEGNRRLITHSRVEEIERITCYDFLICNLGSGICELAKDPPQITFTDALTIGDLTLRVVKNLTNRHVKGDEIIRDIKQSIGLLLPSDTKLIRRNTGGWIVEGSAFGGNLGTFVEVVDSYC